GACPDTRRSNRPCAITTSTHSVFPDSMSLPKLNPVEPPWYGPVCPVVGEGWHREVSHLAVAARSGDGPFTIRFADLHDSAMQTSGLFELAIYALASRLRASWMEARATKAPRVSARFSKSLARRRLRPKQEKVRSTTQRRGRTTKPLHVVAPLEDLQAQK